MHDSSDQRQERTDRTDTETTDTTPPTPTSDGKCPTCEEPLQRDGGCYGCPSCLGVWAEDKPGAELIYEPLEVRL